MFRVLGSRKKLCNQPSRRDLLHIGGLSLFGLSLTDLLQKPEVQAGGHLWARPGRGPTFGKAKSCIVLFLYGAWSQLDTLDLKPRAPVEVRGEFKPIASRLPGVHICEHLPRIAGLLDRVTLVRSLTHPYPTHCVAYALSGIPQNPLRNPAEYWPFYGSVLDYLWDRSQVPQPRGMPRNLCLPWPLNSRSDNQSHRGLTAAWLGREWEPTFAEFHGRPSRTLGFPSARGGRAVHSHLDPFDGITRESTFRFMAPTMLAHAPMTGIAHQIARSGLDLSPGVTLDQMRGRLGLLEQIDAARRGLDRTAAIRSFDRYQQMALDMLTSPHCATALDVTREPEPVRARYGYTLFGQAALAARRLIEAGVRVVTVYWDEYGPANTGWDTHVNNFPRLREGLCPTLDRVYPALLEDLAARGLLDETLVLLVSEHGRTPKIARVAGGGRDHWSYAYCGVLAGAGIRQGQVIGSTDKQAAFPAERPVSPKDLQATLYHLLGFDPETTRTYDSLGRPYPLLPHGAVVREMLI